MLIVLFPTSLGGDGVTEGLSDFLLGSELALAEHNGDEAEVGLVIEGQAVDGFMACEDDTVAIVIDEPQVWVNEGRGVGSGIQRQRQIGGVGVHEGLDVGGRKKVPETAHILRKELAAETREKTGENSPCQEI